MNCNVMTQWWLLLKIIVMSFVPLPINPKMTRPDPKKNFWTFTCDGFTSCFKVVKVFYTDNMVEKTN